MAEPSNRDWVTILIVVLAVLILWPVLMMLGFGGIGMGYGGYGGMMGGLYGSGGSGWVGLGIQLLFLLAILGGGYFVVRRLLNQHDSHDAAREELRRAYARGDLSDEEFETRQSKL
ncbi:SHOCT domain-containing protein [Halogeometricum sp. S1BR25-6]|jgi:putative membrane protein|uniref:SHOCT domain-containing protein n=1 Tax=Halogeometricum salsisoli TaxID=2950536 RepID=A0ABU2GLL6_9EURY|nr:SHOCT domain-containing protein [Halogeometricum sp. S1BR25-6]MDS0301311.1 SHOCT domain-containing protein [Halogeometricum sp. S1BR25-6]